MSPRLLPQWILDIESIMQQNSKCYSQEVSMGVTHFSNVVKSYRIFYHYKIALTIIKTYSQQHFMAHSQSIHDSEDLS